MKSPTPHQIRTARDKAGLTQRQAAELVWLSPRSWAAYESGRYQMQAVIWWAFLERVKG